MFTATYPFESLVLKQTSLVESPPKWNDERRENTSLSSESLRASLPVASDEKSDSLESLFGESGWGSGLDRLDMFFRTGTS